MVDEMGFVRLGARFEPTTRKIGFVAAPPGDVAVSEALERIWRDDAISSGFVRSVHTVAMAQRRETCAQTQDSDRILVCRALTR